MKVQLYPELPEGSPGVQRLCCKGCKYPCNFQLHPSTHHEHRGWDGVSFDLFTVDNYSVRVFCKTKQSYESGWLVLCWTLFGLRLLLFVMVEGFAVNTAVEG